MYAQLHLLPDIERGDASVSARSRWADNKWHLDHDKLGLRDGIGTFNWKLDMGDGTTLLDPMWADLLEDTKKLIWSLLTDARSGRTFDSVTIATGFRVQLGKLLCWMGTNDYASFSEINSEASWEFHDHLLNILQVEMHNKVSSGRFQFELQILCTIYRQSTALEDAGVEPMPEPPYDGATPNKVSKASANAKNGWIEPLPDEVALRVLAESTRWLGTPINDVIKLRDIYLNIVESDMTGERPVENLLSSFKFSTILGEKYPWRASLGTDADDLCEINEVRTRLDSVLRTLIGHAASSCVCLIQGTTGMRVSEIAALRSGINPATGLPNYISVVRSKTGLNELFFLNSQVTKIHNGAMMQWVLGMRPAGSSYVPPAISALLALERLFEPWRAGRGQGWLLVTPGGRGTLSRSIELVKPITRGLIAKQMKCFVAQYGGLGSLPDTLKTQWGSLDIRQYKTGVGFKTHQWRKTFALYILRTDPKMLPAISQHFKHMSLAMTEQGYIGNDPELLESIDSVRRQRTVQFLLAQANGNSIIAGGMAELVQEQRDRLREIVGANSGQDAYDRMEAWVLEADLRIWYAEHGKCFMNLKPEEARCHSLGKTDPWFKREPNYSHRSASVCAGCKCFAVDGEHVNFWQARYRKNAHVLKLAGAGKAGEYRVALERMRQSASILRALKVSIDDK